MLLVWAADEWAEVSDNCLIHNNSIGPPPTCQTVGVSHLPPVEFVVATPLSIEAD